MKTIWVIARLLLGLMFLVFGLNGFFHFLSMSPPSGLALQFLTVLSASHYMVLIFLLQIIGGVVLLTNRFVPLALVVLAPIIVNILMFHILMAPSGIGPGLIALALWVIVYSGVRTAFAGLFAAKVGNGVRKASP